MYIIGLLSIDMPVIILDNYDDYAYHNISDFWTLYKPRNN